MTKPVSRKVSGLVSSGAVVPATPAHALPDIPAHNDPNLRTLVLIPVGLIDPNPLAPREIYTPQMILDRAEDLRSQGQHDPIHVIPNPTDVGRYIICDGWTRVQACLHHKVLDSLLAQIHPDKSLVDAAWFGYEQNEGRQQHCDFDRASFYEKLIAEGESLSEIARRTKVSKQTLSNFKSYAKLPDEILDLVRDHPFKFGSFSANQLRVLYDNLGLKPALALAHRFAVEDHPVRWLSAQVQSLLTPVNKKPALTGKHIRYSNGYYKQRGDSFEVSIAVPEHLKAHFSAELEKLLETVAVDMPVDQKPGSSKGE